MERTGEKKVAFAAKCKIEPESLKQYYSGRHVPGRELVLRFAKVLGCPVSVLVGEPAGAGTDNTEVRAWSDTMYLLGLELSPEQREAVIEMVKAGREMGKARKGK